MSIMTPPRSSRRKEAPAPTSLADLENLADLLRELGNINPRRVRLYPLPGQATEKDILRIHDRTKRHFELVDGVLVEKVTGLAESFLAIGLGHLLHTFLEEHDLGILAGEGGTLRLRLGLVRIPDISFISWKRLPRREIPAEPIPALGPDLAIEIFSKGDTRKEMNRKLREYFLAGVQVVWFVYPNRRVVEVYTAPDQCVVLTEDQTLDGGDVLPGLKLSLQKVFAQLPRQAAKRPSRPRNQAKSWRPKGRNA